MVFLEMKVVNNLIISTTKKVAKENDIHFCTTGIRFLGKMSSQCQNQSYRLIYLFVCLYSSLLGYNKINI